MTFHLYFAKEAVKDAKKIKQAGLAEKAKNLLDIIRENPYQNNPPYEKLVGRLSGIYTQWISKSEFENKGRAPGVYEAVHEDARSCNFRRSDFERRRVYSRRINIQHRLIYQVDEEERVIRVLRMWSHYE